MPAPTRRRIRAAVLILALAGAATAACAGPSTSPAPRSASLGPVPPLQLGAVAQISQSAALRYPIDPFLPTHDQTIAFDRAVNLQVSRCMLQYGFDYLAPQPNITPGGDTDTNAPLRYGVSDPARVARFGYHAPPLPSVAGEKGLPQSELLVLVGSGTDASPGPAGEYQGHPVPPGGCLGATRAALLAHGGAVNADEVAETINNESLADSEREPQVIAATAQWSRCMAQHGYRYANPYDADNDPQWHTANPSAAEIRTASADVACKTQTNLIGIWYAVESALQHKMIAANQAHLDQVEAGIAAQTDAAEHVLASAAGS